MVVVRGADFVGGPNTLCMRNNEVSVAVLYNFHA